MGAAGVSSGARRLHGLLCLYLPVEFNKWVISGGWDCSDYIDTQEEVSYTERGTI